MPHIVMRQLHDAVRPHASGRRAGAAKRVSPAMREQNGYFNARAYFADDAPILPQRVIGELMRNLPPRRHRHLRRRREPHPDDPFLPDEAGRRLPAGGRFRADGLRHSRRARRAKLVHPDRPVVAVCGDGGFAMTMNGLMTAIEQDIPIITVVFNNNALGWVLHGGGPFAAEFRISITPPSPARWAATACA